jgi:hypothetical protein
MRLLSPLPSPSSCSSFSSVRRQPSSPSLRAALDSAPRGQHGSPRARHSPQHLLDQLTSETTAGWFPCEEECLHGYFRRPSLPVRSFRFPNATRASPSYLATAERFGPMLRWSRRRWSVRRSSCWFSMSSSAALGCRCSEAEASALDAQPDLAVWILCTCWVRSRICFEIDSSSSFCLSSVWTIENCSSATI